MIILVNMRAMSICCTVNL